MLDKTLGPLSSHRNYGSDSRRNAALKWMRAYSQGSIHMVGRYHEDQCKSHIVILDDLYEFKLLFCDIESPFFIAIV